jgi:hypothetical protein
MRTVFRVAATSISAIATLYFGFWVGGALLLRFTSSLWIPLIASLASACVVAWFVWTHTASVQQGLVKAIALGALVTGGVMFSAGFFGPILFSTSNLGPLLGIFETGPTGVLLGALWGVCRWGSSAAGPEVIRAWKWVLGIWAISLIYTLWLLPGGAIWGAAVQTGVLGASAAIFYRAGNALPSPARRCIPIVLVGVALVLLMTLFPPVTRFAPTAGPTSRGADATRAPGAVALPTVAFILHKGFDGSRHFPLFAVNAPLLVLEWAATLILVALACYFVISRARRDRSREPA